MGGVTSCILGLLESRLWWGGMAWGRKAVAYMLKTKRTSVRQTGFVGTVQTSSNRRSLPKFQEIQAGGLTNQPNKAIGRESEFRESGWFTRGSSLTLGSRGTRGVKEALPLQPMVEKKEFFPSQA